MRIRPLDGSLGITAAAALVAAVVAGSATAQQPGMEGAPPGGGVGSAEFQKLDKNKDGIIDKKEAAANKDLTKNWNALDLDKDGKLDYGEFARFEAEVGGESSAPSDSDRRPSPVLP